MAGALMGIEIAQVTVRQVKGMEKGRKRGRATQRFQAENNTLSHCQSSCSAFIPNGN